LEYERIYFLDTSASARALALLKKSFCLEQKQDFEGAYANLQRVPLNGLADSLAYGLRYEKILCAYLSADYGNAEYEFQQLDFFVKDTALLDRCLGLRVLVYSELENWNAVGTAFARYAALHHLRTDTLGLEKRIPPRHLRSSQTARILSLFLPGTGQLYCGKPWRALSSVLLQGAAATFAVISIMHGFYFEGIFTGAGLFLRFYTGGARYAGRLAEEKNEKKENEVKQRLKDLILSSEKKG
jgi:hypothetical protein